MSETKFCKIGTKLGLLLMTNRKWNTPFRLVPKSTTLDDLERPIRTLLQKRYVFRSPPQKISMEIDPYSQRRKCRLNLVHYNKEIRTIITEVMFGPSYWRCITGVKNCRKTGGRGIGFWPPSELVLTFRAIVTSVQNFIKIE